MEGLEDLPGQLTVTEGVQVGRPQFGLGLDGGGFLGRKEPKERALRDVGLVGDLLEGGRVVALLGEQPECRVGQGAASPLFLALAQWQRRSPTCAAAVIASRYRNGALRPRSCSVVNNT